MGIHLLDQYSFLHFSAGVVAYFFYIPLLWWFLLNIAFEVIENSEFGMSITRNLPFWPGGKRFRDANINILGDIICVLLGWGAAYLVDQFVKKYYPLPAHLQ